jgi:arylsulfatase A-like enzyme
MRDSLKHFVKYILVIKVILLSHNIMMASSPVSSEEMNVIFILADDLGWSDCTLYGTTKLYETPNLERLAARGLTFTNAYAASPLCSPTRATILTGQATARNGIVNPNCHTANVKLKPSVSPKASAADKALAIRTATRLDTKLPTLGKLVKANGYATAHFGKWHLGLEPYTPLEHGFDVDLPHHQGAGPAGAYVAPWAYPKFKENFPGEHIEDRMSKEAISWMNSVNGEKPFFMNYWMFSVHAPWGAKEDVIDKYRQRIDTTRAQRSPTYAAMVEAMDDAVGVLLDEVDRLGIADRTAIVFLSDNGGHGTVFLRETLPSGEEYITVPTSNAPLKGSKATMYEGGIRVPCVIVWPGLTTPGTRSDARIQSTDFYPTILNLLGISSPENHPVDGIDFSPVLSDVRWEREEPMFTYFPSGPRGTPFWLPPAISVHDGKWKLFRLFYEGENRQHGYLLYDLANDIGETTNLASKNSALVKKMDAMIEKHLKETEAVVPLPNPKFDPAQYRPDLIGKRSRIRVSTPNARKGQAKKNQSKKG